jgi:hypothetical protein
MILLNEMCFQIKWYNFCVLIKHLDEMNWENLKFKFLVLLQDKCVVIAYGCSCIYYLHPFEKMPMVKIEWKNFKISKVSK